MKLTKVLYKEPNAGYIGFILEPPGVNAHGETLEETRENLEDAFVTAMETDLDLAEEWLGWNAIREWLVINNLI
jgi:predicted RNase H-like HicB family nuclease